MASLGDIWDEAGWLADRISLNQYTTYLAMGKSGTIHGLAFELPPSEAHISWTCEVDGVEEGYFHLASLLCGLRFPFPGFVLELLNGYGIAYSQLASNSRRFCPPFT